MYFETVDWATSKPSFRSSPWIRDAPHSGFSLLIRWMRSRRPRSIFGRPTLFRDFQRQKALKPARCHRRMVTAALDQVASRIANYGVPNGELDAVKHDSGAAAWTRFELDLDDVGMGC